MNATPERTDRRPDVAVEVRGAVATGDPGQRVEELAGRAPDPLQFRRLFGVIGSLSHGPIYADSSAELLIDGPDTFDAMSDAIGAAQRLVDVETFIFDDGELGRNFAELLAKRSRDGIAVRVLYDAFGSVASEDDLFRRLDAAGVDIRTFNQINPLDGGNPLDANQRDHRKLLIVDDDIVFTGGINIDSPYRQPSGRKRLHESLEIGWRDTHVAIRGAAVRVFRDLFDRNWRDAGPETDKVLDDQGISPLGAERAGEELVALLRAEGERDWKSPIYRAYFEAMDKAAERIWITQAYFVPDRPFMDKLVEAANRGVDVRIIIPGVSDSKLVLYASRSCYDRLLRGGVRIYENCDTFIHAKTAVIDGIWSTVGSSNLDARSFLHNDEVNAVIFGCDFARRMEAQFQDDLGTCEGVDLDVWRRRPLRDRVKERASRLLARWI